MTYIQIVFVLLILGAANLLPESIALSNANSVLIGFMFLILDYIHRKNPMSALIVIGVGTVFAACVAPQTIVVTGSLTFLASALMDWVVFNKVYAKTRSFACSLIMSNFFAAMINSILFSMALNHHKSFEFGPVVLIGAFATIIPIYFLYHQEIIRARTAAFGISACAAGYIAISCTNAWTDPSAIEYAQAMDWIVRSFFDLFNITIYFKFKEVLWLVDMVVTSIYKIAPPVIYFYAVYFFNRLFVFSNSNFCYKVDINGKSRSRFDN